jgi:hypothetical protein
MFCPYGRFVSGRFVWAPDKQKRNGIAQLIIKHWRNSTVQLIIKNKRRTALSN